MSFAPAYATVAASTAVKALIGSSPVRFYLEGAAPQGVVAPYATYQQIGGGPENYLNQLPDIDSGLVQINVYAATLASAEAVAKAIRNAVELVAYVTAVRHDGRDADTKNYRVSIDTDWLTDR